jgi:hypothetical protein
MFCNFTVAQNEFVEHFSLIFVSYETGFFFLPKFANSSILANILSGLSTPCGCEAEFPGMKEWDTGVGRCSQNSLLRPPGRQKIILQIHFSGTNGLYYF